MKTLIINGKVKAAGSHKAMIRQSARIIKQEKIENPTVVLTEGFITQLEKCI